MIANDGTGTNEVGHYDVIASHAGKYFNKRKEPYKKGKVRNFKRKLSPYILQRALKAIGEI